MFVRSLVSRNVFWLPPHRPSRSRPSSSSSSKGGYLEKRSPHTQKFPRLVNCMKTDVSSSPRSTSLTPRRVPTHHIVHDNSLNLLDRPTNNEDIGTMNNQNCDNMRNIILKNCGALRSRLQSRNVKHIYELPCECCVLQELADLVSRYEGLFSSLNILSMSHTLTSPDTKKRRMAFYEEVEAMLKRYQDIKSDKTKTIVRNILLELVRRT